MTILPSPEIVISEGIDKTVISYFRGFTESRFFIVTGPHVSRTFGFEKLTALLENEGKNVTIYNQTKGDPTVSQVDEMICLADDARAEAVIGIGGGSPLDAAKLVAALRGTGESCRDYLSGTSPVRKDTALILIPTTSGTGSEVTPYSIVTDESDNVKKAIASRYLIPDYAFLISELTITMPPGITAATGMDALCHAAEAYLSLKKNDYSDAKALSALKLIAENLPTAYSEPDNKTARSNMLMASLLAGQAFANASVTAVHAFAYPLGGLHHTPHGLANSLFLLPVFQHNLRENRERIARIAQEMGFGKDAEDFITGAEELRRKLKLPLTLREVNVPEEDLSIMAEKVMGIERLLSVNPTKIHPEDALRIYREAYFGITA